MEDSAILKLVLTERLVGQHNMLDTKLFRFYKVMSPQLGITMRQGENASKAKLNFACKSLSSSTGWINVKFGRSAAGLLVGPRLIEPRWSQRPPAGAPTDGQSVIAVEQAAPKKSTCSSPNTTESAGLPVQHCKQS